MTGSPPSGPAGEPEPLGAPERRLWLLEQLEPGGTAYDDTVALRLHGPVDPAVLQSALVRLAHRHPRLRSRVAFLETAPVWLPAGSPVRLEVEDLRPLPDPAAASAAARQAEPARPIDPSRGPLLRARLLRTGDEAWELLLHVHGLATDPVGRQLLLDGLGAAYAAELDGAAVEPPAFAAGPGPAGAASPAAEQWWLRQLADAVAPGLPVDTTPQAAGGSGVGRRVEPVPPELSTAVSELARSAAVPPVSVWLAGLAAVLGRHARLDAVVLGTPLGGLPRPPAVGRRVEELPVVVDLRGHPGLRRLAGRVAATLRQAAEHPVPLEALEHRAAAGGGAAELGRFRVAGAAEPAIRPPALDGLTVTAELLPPGELPVDLRLTVRADGPGGEPGAGDRVSLLWTWSADRVGDADVARLAGHLRELLGAALRGPDTPLDELDLLPATERAELERWGRGGVVGPGPVVLSDWIAGTAAELPTAAAVRGPDGALTYAELDTAANRLAHHLRSLGAATGQRVGVCLDRGTGLLVGLLGVLKSGAAYVPIEPTYPAERIAFLLEDAGCRVVVSTAPVAARLPASAAVVVRLDADADAIAAQPATPVPGGPGPDDVAYVIYTSGSTGRPKGVMVRHAGVCALLRAMAERPGLRRGETMVGVTTPAFDLSVPDLFLPLVTGARLVLAGREHTVDGPALAALLLDADAALMQATPSTWRLLVDSGWRGTPQLRVVVGGEAVPAALAADLVRRSAGVWNFYGPTEATVWCTAARLDGPAGTGVDDPLTIGAPLPGVELFVVDRRDRLVPVGVAGELLVGGAGVARGYLGRPELTSSQFVRLPLTHGRPAYRTGDLVRWRAGGLLEFVGRVDHQVKLRGFRIELGEVEAALRAQPGVRDAVVLLREDTPGAQRLVGYLVGPQRADPAELAAALAVRLPGYMVPVAYVALPAFPLTPNGKLDRAALPRPDAAVAAPAGWLPPRTPVEQALARLWQEVLGVERVGVHDDFFALGGHSLLVLRVAARLPHLLPVQLSVRRLFELPTLEQLAVAVTQELAAQSLDEELAELLAGLEAGGPA